MEEEIMALTQIRVPAVDGSGDFGAYLAMPRAGKGPGLVLCQEIFGPNEPMRSAAENFAEEGYVVLVPDLFWRQQPGVVLGYPHEDWNRAFQPAPGFAEARGAADVKAAFHPPRSAPRREGCGGAGGHVRVRT